MNEFERGDELKNMRKKRIPPSSKKIFPILLFIATIFMSVGYASINSIIMNINGEVIAKAQDGIYITEVNYVSDVNANLEESKILNAYQTNLSSNVVLSDIDSNSSITYEIIFYNSSDFDYKFDGIEYLIGEDTYSNDNIVFEINGLEINEILEKNQTKTVTITFKYNYIMENNILKSLLNFKFSINPYVVATYEYTGNYETFVTPHNGIYKLEVWGAQGGSYSDTYLGGKGGYSVGNILLEKNTELYVYVGGMGNMTKVSSKIAYGGYNGGGDSSLKNSTDTNFKNVSGGGSTDIRLISGDSQDEQSLYSRIIVAGGGAGSSYYSSKRIGYGGAGGGLTGIDGTAKYNSNYLGTGGTQLSGGNGYKTALNGGFGFGGNGDTSGEWNGTGGGGGWYGGAAGYSYQGAGGGGSGWCFTEENYNYWSLNNITDATKYTVDTKYYLTDASTISGIESFYDPDQIEVIGHSGNGYARITFIAENED